MNLSNTTLSNFVECPRCFYLDKKLGVKKPASIFAGILSALDSRMKASFDTFRGSGGFPNSEFGELFKAGWRSFTDQEELRKMRHWKSGLKYISPNGFTLTGAFDDLMYHPQYGYMPLDYKSKAKPTNEADTKKFYQLQGDIYTLLLERDGKKVNYKASFCYYRPSVIREDMSMFWEAQLITIDTEPRRALEVFNRASDCLSSDMPPDPAKDCAMCNYIKERELLWTSTQSE